MLRAIIDVVRGEGVHSAWSRASERVSEAIADIGASRRDAEVLNVASGGLGARTGGVAVQLRARLTEERRWRKVTVTSTFPVSRVNAIHVEGTESVKAEDLLRFIDSGTRVVVSVHDWTLIGDPHARELLERATGVIFPSRFLLDDYNDVVAPSDWRAEVIEPASASHAVPNANADGVAFAGAVRRDKGAHLLPAVAALLARSGRDLHVFGGGDRDVFALLRRSPNVVIHGYYRAAELPAMLARHRIGLVLLPSIVRESYCLTLSEAWLGGAAAAMFDLGAPAERVRRLGGGWLAPADSGGEGLIAIAGRWLEGARVPIPDDLPTPAGAALAHVGLYRRWSLLPPR